jgi:hypothetical protein
MKWNRKQNKSKTQARRLEGRAQRSIERGDLRSAFYQLRQADKIRTGAAALTGATNV